MTSYVSEISRRHFLRLTAGGALTLSLAAACVPTAPSAPSTSPTRPAAAGPTTTAGANAVYPAYRPLANALKPDLPADGPQYDDGFNSYPATPAKAMSSEAPGTGGTIKAMSIALFPPPTPMDQNPAWQAVNKALNATMQIEVVTQADYAVKLGTAMAGSDLPDMLYLYTRAGSSSTLAAATGMPQFLQSQAADLTPYLAGDAAKDYPNLAAVPTQAWKNAGCAYQGHLYMVPLHRYLPGQMFVKNVTAWDQALGKDYAPTNAADFKRALQALTKPQQGFYGIVAAQDSVMHMATWASIFGAPNGWRLEPSGTLVKDIETPEYRAALEYARDLYASGVFHPDSLNYPSNVIARTNFIGGKFAVHRDPINGWQDAWRQALRQNPPFEVRPISLFPAYDGGKPLHYVTGGHLWATVLKKSTPEKTKELLRIMNWLATPFGSEEDQLLTFGVRDVDYAIDAKGNPTLTEKGNTDANYVPWKYIAQHPLVFYSPDLPNYAKVMYDTEHMVMPYAVSDPTFGQVSTTDFSKGFTLTQRTNEGIVDIAVGRRPMTEFDQVIKEWQASGGEQIRKEYAESIAANA